MKLLLLIPLFLISLAFFSFTKNKPEQFPIVPLEEVPNNIDYYLIGAQQKSFKQSGTVDFTLNSKEIKHFEQEDESSLQEPNAYFKRSSDWSIQAQQGYFFHQPEIVHFIKDALINKQDKQNYYKIHSDLLELNIKQDIVISKKPVTVSGKNWGLNARSMQLNLDTEQHLFNSVKARYRHDKST